MWSNFVKTGNPTPSAVGGPADGGPTLQGIEDIVWRPVMPAASEVQNGELSSIFEKADSAYTVLAHLLFMDKNKQRTL